MNDNFHPLNDKWCILTKFLFHVWVSSIEKIKIQAGIYMRCGIKLTKPAKHLHVMKIPNYIVLVQWKIEYTQFINCMTVIIIST